MPVSPVLPVGALCERAALAVHVEAQPSLASKTDRDGLLAPRAALLCRRATRATACCACRAVLPSLQARARCSTG